MIGTVIEGRFQNASVNMCSGKNALCIETPDKKQIELSKENIISIDDVTEQYPDKGKKVMLVLWNDFETSIIQLGMVASSQPTDKSKPAEAYYLGTKAVAHDQIQELKSLIANGKKTEAVNVIRSTTGLSLTDANYIVGCFNTLDFSRPQSLPDGTTSSNSVSQDNTSTNSTVRADDVNVFISGKYSGCKLKRDTVHNMAFTVPHFVSLTKNNIDRIDVINSANTPVGSALKGAIVAGAVGALVASSTTTEILVEIVWKDGETSIARVSKGIFESMVVGVRNEYSEEQLANFQKQRQEQQAKNDKDSARSVLWTLLIGLGWLIYVCVAVSV